MNRFLKAVTFGSLEPSFARQVLTTYIQVRHQSRAKIGVLMLNMGGPRHQEEVHDFLLRIITDRDMVQIPFQSVVGPVVARLRTPAIKAKYADIGGHSPLYSWTDRQGELLTARLNKECQSAGSFKHYIGFRYTKPLTEDALEQMEKDGVEHCIAFSQYPMYSCSTSGSSFNAIHQYFEKRGNPKMRLTVIDRWGSNPFLVQYFAKSITRELDHFPQKKRKDVGILFSAHSLPLKQVQKGDQYPAEVGSIVNLVMKELEFSHPHWLVWQSKVGPFPWLRPSTYESISGMVQRGKNNLVLVPIAFVNENIETLHELDIQYVKQHGEMVGAERIGRCAAPNDDPDFIDALVYEVKHHLEDERTCSQQFLSNCPLCRNPACFATKRWFRSVLQI